METTRTDAENLVRLSEENVAEGNRLAVACLGEMSLLEREEKMRQLVACRRRAVELTDRIRAALAVFS